MNDKLACGCTPDASGYGYCSECRRSLRNKIWKNLSRSQRDYDRLFAPDESAELDDYFNPDYEHNTGCSCHINPPCSYCTSKSEEDFH